MQESRTERWKRIFTHKKSSPLLKERLDFFVALDSSKNFKERDTRYPRGSFHL